MNLRFFDALEGTETILLAGMGGGYDVFAGMPLYFALREMGKRVYLANLSFSTLYASNGRRLGTALVEVTARTEARLRYFPELYLAQWFQQRGEEVPVYCLDRTGARPVAAGYRTLVELLQPDAVVLVDGGTDSLMRGDEVGLGTPEEDAASLAAVQALDVPMKLLACIGFGVDTFHGVCHAHFLEAVAALAREGAFLGAWSLTAETAEAHLYREASDFVFDRMSHHPSIVNSSILSAVEGQFGDYHTTERTAGSELFINPLMGLYWGFQLEAVAGRNLYLDRIRETETYQDLQTAILQFRASLAETRPWISLPM